MKVVTTYMRERERKRESESESVNALWNVIEVIDRILMFFQVSFIGKPCNEI